MEATINLGTKENVRERLISMTEPKNAILARLQKSFIGKKSENVVCSYSRMHNRHNRG